MKSGEVTTASQITATIANLVSLLLSSAAQQSNLRMFSHIALILSEKTSSLAVSSSSMVDFNDEDIDTKYLTDGDTPVSEMGYQGTGGPWWIWIIVGVLIFALCACLGKFKAIFSFSLR